MFGPENPWEVNRGLTSLDLGDNDLVLEGAASLAGALQVLERLRLTTKDTNE